MSPQETQALQEFLNQLTQVRGVVKDPQADAMIAAAVAQQPDTSYLLVQRALLMEQAVAASKARIAALQDQVQNLQSGQTPSSGFLDSNAWGHAPSAAPRPAFAPAPAPAAAAVAAPQAAMPYQTAAPSSGLMGGGMGSMLGTVAATAAGVAGGAFLFQGIEHLMNGSGTGLSHQNASGTPVENVENTTVNNYYGSDTDKSSTLASDDSTSEAASGNDLSDLANVDLDCSDNGDDFMV